MLILHSAMSCKERFFGWVPSLARQYRTVRMDLRGHGASDLPPPDVPLTLDRLVDDALELMDELGLATAHVIGASAGGHIAQRIAIDHPSRASSLCLFASTPGLKRSQAASWLPEIRERGLRAFLTETISDRFPVGEVEQGLVDWFIDQASSTDEDSDRCAADLARFLKQHGGGQEQGTRSS